MNDKAKEFFSGKKFEVEHALNLYADSFVNMPAFAIYEKDAITRFRETLDKCHIYMIGYLPDIELSTIRQEDNKLIISLSVLGETHEIRWPLPQGSRLECDQGHYYVSDQQGRRFFPSEVDMVMRLSLTASPHYFDVQYIGQAYGQSGERTAFERLLKHETLQKIAIKGVPKGYHLEILFLEVISANRVITMFNPHAAETDDDHTRIDAGLNKLFGTSERERISLYEACMIRHFRPKFNIEFKDSFPSTNLKVLKECYEKDFSAVTAEICFDVFPYRIGNECVKPEFTHAAKFNLHDESERRVFFDMS